MLPGLTPVKSYRYLYLDSYLVRQGVVPVENAGRDAQDLMIWEFQDLRI